MKNIILLSSLLLASIAVHSQSTKDYNKIIDVITTSYNTNDSILISSLYTQELKNTLATKKENAFVPEDAPDYFVFDQDQHGKIMETALIMNDVDSNVYYIQFERHAKILTLALSENNQITSLDLKD